MKIFFRKIANSFKRFWNWLKEKGRTHVEILITIIFDAILVVSVNWILGYALYLISLNHFPSADEYFQKILKNILHGSAIISLLVFVISDLFKSVIKNYKDIKKILGCRRK